MPLMKPPHYNGVKYNGAEVLPGALVNVSPVDVEAHLAEHWEIAGDVSALPLAATVAINGDETRERPSRKSRGV